jgi:hypothetical protein
MSPVCQAVNRSLVAPAIEIKEPGGSPEGFYLKYRISDTYQKAIKADPLGPEKSPLKHHPHAGG